MDVQSATRAARHRPRADRQAARRPIAVRADGADSRASSVAAPPTRTSEARRSCPGAITLQVHGSTGALAIAAWKTALSTAALISPANSQITFNMAASQEIAVDYSGAGADTAAGGVRMNVIPREGGNTFNGVALHERHDRRAGQQQLHASGCRTPVSARRTASTNMFDVNPGFGGPLRRDKAWFYFSGRRATSCKWMADEFYDKQRQQPERLDLSARPEPSPVSNDSDVNDAPSARRRCRPRRR